MNINFSSPSSSAYYQTEASFSFSQTPTHAQMKITQTSRSIQGSQMILMTFTRSVCMHSHTPLEMLLTGRIAHGFHKTNLSIQIINLESEEGVNISINSSDIILYPRVRILVLRQASQPSSSFSE